jgi:REP element-mobilizing transposase RayT
VSDTAKHLRHLDRVWIENPIYFITTCTQCRRQVLAVEPIHAILREVWANAEKLYGWYVGRYVVMPDHVHFFCASAVPVAGVSDPGAVAVAGVSDPGYSALPGAVAGVSDPGYSASLSMFVGKWKEWTAKYAHRRLKMPPSLWQPEFFDHVLRSGESYEQKWEYVRENPVRAELVARPEDWPYQGEIHDLRFEL